MKRTIIKTSKGKANLLAASIYDMYRNINSYVHVADDGLFIYCNKHISLKVSLSKNTITILEP